MHAFVTGGTGLLGSTLVRQLAQEGYVVTALVRSREKAANLFTDLPIKFVQGDLDHVAGFAEALTGCDVVFHTAAFFREYYQPGDHWRMLQAINIYGTLALLQAARERGVQTFVHTSTSGTSGPNPAGGPSDETTPPGALAHSNLYFRSKVLTDQAIARFVQAQAMRVLTIHPAWMWGPGDAAPTASGQLVLDFLARKIPAIIPGGSMVVDVRDVAQTMIRAVERGKAGEHYLVAGRYAALSEIMHTLEGVSGVPGPRLRLPYAATLAYAWFAQTMARLRGRSTLITLEGIRTQNERFEISSAKAMRELGATFRPLPETLRDEVAWFRERADAAISKANDQLRTAL